jgi:hypothetical protein
MQIISRNNVVRVSYLLIGLMFMLLMLAVTFLSDGHLFLEK